ncbi:radial spoke head 14 homolog [Exaiptasia diaphana]|uniref:Radial spoke head 14 homolog n=1 Tax=Exaiptasia diaphana TaxID=2652724 RepID=A0A913WQ98_EXADI|nr:radial spoke head 14 homolog [Exaiptasia diaphana]KXJ18833.1 Radial spoke head 14-like [Exaiptasia diaphana]
MATTVISVQLPPDIDPTKARLAYGDRALPKLNRELNSDDLKLKQKALMTLCDVMHNPEHICEGLRVGIATSLKSLLKDPDPTVRHKSTEVLFIIAGHAPGRDAFLDHNIILPLSELFDDNVYQARRNAHKAIEMCSHTSPGTDGVVEAKLVSVLVKKLLGEEDEIKELILDTLHYCMRIETSEALTSNAMEAFTQLLGHKSATIRCKAARDIMDLSFPLEGKDRAVDVGAVPELVKLLQDCETDVRAQAAGAIMGITITTKGKYAAIEADAIPNLVELLLDRTSEVRLNALKAITTLAEAPVGRTTLLKSVIEVEKLVHDHDSPAVRKAAQIAVKVITWKP